MVCDKKKRIKIYRVGRDYGDGEKKKETNKGIKKEIGVKEMNKKEKGITKN